MTPEQLQEMWAWYQARREQQLEYPVDDASRNAIGAAVGQGLGSSTLTQTITIGSGGGSATVPANPAGSFILNVEGVNYEIAYVRVV